MIDTDKYEGHTEGPWVCTRSPVNGGGQFWSVVDHTQPTDVGDDTLGNWRIADIIDFEADAQLIADAPLLLQEVKRLREQGRKLIEAAERVRSDISDQDTGWYYQLGNHIEKMNRLVIE